MELIISELIYIVMLVVCNRSVKLVTARASLNPIIAGWQHLHQQKPRANAILAKAAIVMIVANCAQQMIRGHFLSLQLRVKLLKIIFDRYHL
jgi:hypothetical protein